MSYNLDQPLLRLAHNDYFTLQHATQGTHVFGATGAGKTSGTGAVLAGAFLREGMGGLVLCAKAEEVDLWQRYAERHARGNSITLFDEHQGFNFLNHQMARHGAEGIGSVVECLMQVQEAARRASPSPGSTGEAFWQDGIRKLLHYAVPALYAANGTVSIQDIIAFVLAGPTIPGQHQDPQFQKTNLVYQTLHRAMTAPKVPADRETIEAAVRYWFHEFPGIPDRTRGNITTSLTSTLDRFNHGRLNRAFCQKTTIVPEMCFNGAIIVMAMPALTWGADGIIGQQIFKYMWQRVVESRNGLPQKFRERPVFLWADEAQYFVNSYDSDFLSTCRSSRACVVFLSQNLPTYYAKMGKDEMVAADALIGKFNTHVFHQNACPRTNEFASSLIGRGLQRRATYSYGTGSNRNTGMNSGANTSQSTSSSAGGGGGSSSWSSGGTRGSGESWGDNRGLGSSENSSQGYSEVMEALIEPAWFSHGLKSGGPAHGNQVTGVWFQNGGNFKESGGGNLLFVTFKQVRP